MTPNVTVMWYEKFVVLTGMNKRPLRNEHM